MPNTQPPESNHARQREIDALFRLGGLTHSPHRKPKAVGESGASEEKTSASMAKKRSGRAAPKPKNAGPEILRVPQWEQYGWLAHGFSTRAGGVSTAYRPGDRSPCCGELNLGFTTADPRENVERNRELFVQALLGGEGARDRKSEAVQLRLLRQIHSGLVHRTANSVDAGGNGGASLHDDGLRGDGMIATEPGALLGIQTADCIPVLIADVRQRIVAAFHAGWRGTLARIAERGVGRLRAEFGSRPGDLTAAIGPGIGRCCYSVGEEVRMEFGSQFGYADALFEEVFDLDPIKEKYPMLFLTARAPGHSNLGPSLHLDLVEANRRQLLDAGIAPRKIHALNLCTACDTKRFFSHRAEQGFTGRMLSVIGIRPLPAQRSAAR
ncbi:MAG: peptidoglycan editing factor PgeF [Acidobacteriaceae bacterium]